MANTMQLEAWMRALKDIQSTCGLAVDGSVLKQQDALIEIDLELRKIISQMEGALWLLGLTEGGSAPVADDDGWEPEVN